MMSEGILHGPDNPMLVTHAFSNGTEGDAWTSKWCDYCAHDHGMHHGEGNGPSCDLVLNSMMHKSGQPLNPEAWVAEPDDGRFFLPSRMICLRFEPCHRDRCTGDPGAADRARRVAEVQAYWRERARP